MPLSLKKFFPGIFWVILLGVFAFRILHLPNAPFLNDEPRLLVQVEKSYSENTWPQIGPTGSQPIPYGPIPHWFYQIVRNLSPAPDAPHWAHGMVFLLASMLAISTVALSLGATSALFFGFLIGSSPYLFMYSQMPWEVLLLVPGSALVAFSWLAFFHAQKASQVIQAGVIAGLGIAICLGTHLMSASVLIAFVFFWMWNVSRQEQQKNSVIFFLCAGLVSAICLAPYAFGIWQFLHSHSLSDPGKNPLMGDGRQLWWSILKTPMHLGIWQMKTFLEPEDGLFFSSLPGILGKFYYADPFGWLAKVMMWAGVCSIAVSVVKRREVSPLFLFGSIGILVHIVLLQILNLATYPHYFLPFWWAPFLLLLQWNERIWGKILLSLLVAGNLVFLYSYTKFVDKRDGTRGDYYGTTFQQQRTAFELICQHQASPLRLDISAVRLQVHSAHYFLKKIEGCRNKPTEISKVPLTGERISLRYGKGADLEVEILK